MSQSSPLTERPSACVPRAMTAAGVWRSLPAAIRPLGDSGEVGEAHEDDDRAGSAGELGVVEILARGRMAGDERDLRGDAAVRDRDAGRGGHGRERGDAGDDLVGDAGLDERLGLLAAAAEDERVAALEPDDLEARLAELDQELVQLGLAELLARDHERIGRAPPRRARERRGRRRRARRSRGSARGRAR